jgi:hypothetical protein
MQSRIAVHIGSVWVGAFVQQEQENGFLSAGAGFQQWRCAVQCGLIHVRACSYEHFGGLHIAGLRGKRQRSKPALCAGMNVGATIDHDLRDFRMLFRSRPHQSRLTGLTFFCVQLCSTIDKQLYDLGTAQIGRGHQRRFSRHQLHAWIRSSLQEFFDHRRVCVGAGDPQRRGAIIIRCVYLRTGSDEKFRHSQVVAFGSPGQGGCAVGLRRVYVDTLGQQRTNGGNVPLPRRFNQWIVGPGCAEADHRKQRHHAPNNQRSHDL